MRAIESVDTKAEHLWGAALGLWIVAAAGVSFAVREGNDAVDIAALVVGGVSLLAFGIVTVLFMRGHKILEWNLGPPASAAYRHLSMNRTRWLTMQLERTWRVNAPNLTTKVRWYDWAQRAFLAQLIFVAVGAMTVAIVAVVENETAATPVQSEAMLDSTEETPD